MFCGMVLWRVAVAAGIAPQWIIVAAHRAVLYQDITNAQVNIRGTALEWVFNNASSNHSSEGGGSACTLSMS
jgi:hypothetical protein